MWIYTVTTGVLARGMHVGVGYSGHGAGLNQPDLEREPNVGPIPRGNWVIGHFFDHPELGPMVAPLLPYATTLTFGRSGFFIHGDNAKQNHSGSDGCIVLARPLRERIKNSGDQQLRVI